MVRILGISGSLRAQSFNTALLRAAQAVARAQSVFGADGTLQDETIRKQLAEFVQGFAVLVARSRRESEG